MIVLLAILLFGLLIWGAWVLHYAKTQYPIDRRIDRYTSF